MEPSATTLVVSDVHLGAVPEANEDAFHGFLDRLPGLAGELLINGDLFDFWFEYRHVVLRRHFATLRKLADLVDAGVRVCLVGGNHDAWGDSFLRDQVGMELLPGEQVIRLRGHRTYLAHGDGLGEGDRAYRAFRSVARSRLAVAAFRTLHPDLGASLARALSGTRARHAAGPGSEEERARRLAQHAERLLQGDPELDLVVLGHSHRPECAEVRPGRYYLNPGDWLHHFTYGVVDSGGVGLRRWTPA